MLPKIKGVATREQKQGSPDKCSEAKKHANLQLTKEKHEGCGSSYASELLSAAEGIEINREPLRLWMLRLF